MTNIELNFKQDAFKIRQINVNASTFNMEFTFMTLISLIYRLTKSDFREPVNIGSDEMVSMNEMAEIVLSFEDRKLPIQHIPGPEGVRGRNSDNTLIKEKLGWAPTMRLKVSIVTSYLICCQTPFGNSES